MICAFVRYVLKHGYYRVNTVYISGWRSRVFDACLDCHWLPLWLNSFIMWWQLLPISHTRDLEIPSCSKGYLKAGDRRWKEGGEGDEFPSSFSLFHSHSESSNFLPLNRPISLSQVRNTIPRYQCPFLLLLKSLTSSFPPFSLFHQRPTSFHLFLSLLPPLSPFIALCSFMGFQSLQCPLYPRDTIRSIHITSRDRGATYLEGT